MKYKHKENIVDVIEFNNNAEELLSFGIVGLSSHMDCWTFDVIYLKAGEWISDVIEFGDYLIKDEYNNISVIKKDDLDKYYLKC